MKATLGLEAIGGFPYRAFPKTGIELIDSTFEPLRPWPCWVAKIVDMYGTESFKLEFLDGKRDYSRANSKGTRGIFVYYILGSGFYYEVKNSISWSRTEQYFCKVNEEGEIIRVDRREVEGWISTELWKRFKEKRDGQRNKTPDGD